MNRLVLAVAGGRKTQGIVEGCCCTEFDKRILTLTYTQANQNELRSRLARHGPPRCRVDVQGWYSFLLGHWVRPYLPRKFSGRRLRGFNFDGEPPMKASGRSRFLDSSDRAYKRHLASLAFQVNEASGGAVVSRLADIYDLVYIDEVQDLNGWDLEIVDALLTSTIDVEMVGDVRQAILDTNYQDLKNKQFKGPNVLAWFEKQEELGQLTIEHQDGTWRSTQEIAELASAALDGILDLPPLVARDSHREGHAGLFRVQLEHAEIYAAQYSPLCLRSLSNTGNACDLPYVTIGKAKGLEADHVLIWPTNPMAAFIKDRKQLKPMSSCAFYVAVTRARSSVAFISDAELRLPVWTPAPQ